MAVNARGGGRVAVALVVVLVVSLWGLAPVGAAPGDLDPTFGGDGIVRTQAADPNANFPFSEARVAVVQPDGKIVAAGEARDANNDSMFGLVRYNPDGSPDTSFGDGGVVGTQATDPNANFPSSAASGVVVQSDGKIVAAGQALDANNDSAFGVVRYNPDGGLDASFGGDGIVRTQAADPNANFPSSAAFGVVVQSDGKIVVAGRAEDANNDSVFGVVRYNPDGSLDTSFGGDGVVRTQAADPNANPPSSLAFGVVVQSDGKIVAAGQALDANNDSVFGVVRYNADGSLDSGFGGDGVVRTQAADPGAGSPFSVAFGVVVQPDGKIVVAGQAEDANDIPGFGVVRYEGAPPPVVGERIGGADRYATAGLVARQVVGCELVVASGENFPDGLTGAVFGLPVLLTRTGSLPGPTVAALDGLERSCDGGLEQIIVLGGPAAVSDGVFAQLGGYTSNIVRLAGANRYQTAIAIAETAGVGDAVIVATGEDFPDALAGGVLAAREDIPIILNSGDTLRPDVAAFFADNPGVDQVFVLGGTAAVPATVADELASQFGVTIRRLAGSDRFATATAIAAEVLPDPGCVLIVNGMAFPDAVSGGPFGAARGCPITLVNRNLPVPQPTSEWLTANAATIQRVTAIGGTAVISDPVLAVATALT